MSARPSDPPVAPRRWRGIAAWVLVVLTAIAVTASVVGLWVNRIALQTDAFMATVTPVVESEAVQTVIADRISDELTEALDLENRIAAVVSEAEQRLVTRIGEALEVSPEILERLVESRLGLERIAPALASGAEARIEDAVHRFVSSPEGTQALLALVEVAHERTVHLLREEYDQLPNLVVTEGEVRFNAVPLMAAALRVVINSGLDIVGVQREIPPFDSTEDAEAAVTRLASILDRDLPADFGQVRIGTGENLERAQDLARLFDRVVWLVLAVTVGLAVGAVLLAPSLRRGIVRVGAAAAVGALAGWLAVELITANLADAAATADGRTAITDVTGALVASLRVLALFLAALGTLAVVLGMLPTVIPKRLEAEPPTAGTPPPASSVDAGPSTAPAGAIEDLPAQNAPAGPDADVAATAVDATADPDRTPRKRSSTKASGTPRPKPATSQRPRRRTRRTTSSEGPPSKEPPEGAPPG